VAKVLLVEDDNNLREIYQARLAAEGYDIIAAQNGEEALVVAKQHKPDLIISDVMMPRISGFEMLDILRNTDALKHTKIIMLTALGQAEDQKRADNLGANRYLVKSQVTLEDIVNAAKELLDDDGSFPAPPSVVPEVEMQPSVSEPTPQATAPIQAVAPAVPTIPEPTPVVEAPTPAPIPAAAPSPVAEPIVPASVLPQPDTIVVVPPAPASPEPIAVVAAVPQSTVEPAQVTVQPAEPVAEPPAAPMPASDPVVVATPPSEPTPVVEPPVASDPVVALPPAMDAVTAIAPPAPTDAAEAAVSVADAQTLEAEVAALQAQIDGYANAPAAPAPAVEPTTDAAASNDQAIAEAVEELNTPVVEEPLQPPSVVHAQMASTEPTPVVAAPAPAVEPTVTPTAAPTPVVPPVSTNPENVTVAGKKIIQPINDITTKPSLDELLAKEEARTPVQPATPVLGGTQETPTPTPSSVPGQSFDPNSIAL
jgi:CheY-like chemotaxis protein